MTERNQHNLEQDKVFRPKFDSSGLLSAVVVDAERRDVLMVAFMDRESKPNIADTSVVVPDPFIQFNPRPTETGLNSTRPTPG